MANGAAMFNTSCLVTVAPTASATCTVKIEPVATAGVPLNTPDPVRVRPEGSEPDETDQVKGAAPPVEIRVWE